jgi:hypothetical protein
VLQSFGRRSTPTRACTDTLGLAAAATRLERGKCAVSQTALYKIRLHYCNTLSG